MADTNPRITVLAEGVIVEALSPLTNIEWNPETNQGAVSFSMRNYLQVNGKYQASLGLEAMGPLTVPLDVAFPKTYAKGMVDPITGADLSGVSGAGAALLLKAMFHTEFSENWQRQQYRPDLE